MSLTVKDSELLILDMIGAAQDADKQVAEENKRAIDTFTMLFQKMRQTIEQLSEENAALRVQLLAADTRNSEAHLAHQAMLRELNGHIDAAKREGQEKEQLLQKQVEALQGQENELKKQVAEVRWQRDAATNKLNSAINLLRQIADAQDNVRNFRDGIFYHRNPLCATLFSLTRQARSLIQ